MSSINPPGCGKPPGSRLRYFLIFLSEGHLYMNYYDNSAYIYIEKAWRIFQSQKLTRMKQLIQTILLLGLVMSCNGSEFDRDTSYPPSHELWDQLLNKHVSPDGLVDYDGMIQDKNKLVTYLGQLSASPPDKKTWTTNEQLAYWINAYNAFTVKLIVDHYPVRSIRELHPGIKIPGIRTVWHKKFFRIGGKKSSLHRIEHKILRREFDEPRIHFAINCASVSCPPLRNEAFTPGDLERQLEEQAYQFINDRSRNQMGKGSLKISKIFKWFRGDFTQSESIIEYLNSYSSQQIDAEAIPTYMEYDWNLNNQK